MALYLNSILRLTVLSILPFFVMVTPVFSLNLAPNVGFGGFIGVIFPADYTDVIWGTPVQAVAGDGQIITVSMGVECGLTSAAKDAARAYSDSIFIMG